MGTLTHLFLHNSQLFQVAFQKGHLLLLSLAVTVPDDIVVLFFQFIELNFQLNNLVKWIGMSSLV